MKITNKGRHEGTSVRDIKSGEIFTLDGEYYLKLSADCRDYESFNSARRERMIDDIVESLDTISSREDVAAIVASYTNSYNAVNLETNDLTYVSGTVLLVDGELVINGLK